MGSVERICVFCGKSPNSKNKEHVIPQWLLKHTRAIDKEGYFGFDKSTGVPRRFAFKAFTFPACEACNTLFAELEAKAKPIILKLLSNDPLSNEDFHYLLDWFDKVRIGLWIGFYYLDKNVGNISPKFHIRSRITQHDRMLYILNVRNETPELSFRGCDTLSFHFTPSCFTMNINNFCFYNISSPFLFSRRIGFPYPSKSYLRKDGLADYSFEPARQRIMYPLIRKPFAFKGVGIYQPIFRSVLNTHFYAFYDNDYIKSNSLSFQNGVGDIFLDSNMSVKPYPSKPTIDWRPSTIYKRHSMNPTISIDTLNHQLHIETLMPSTEQLPDGEKKWWRETLSETRRYANWLIKTMKDNARKGIS